MATQTHLVSRLSYKPDHTRTSPRVKSKTKLPKPRKSDTLLRLVSRVNGAQMTGLQKATGWQAHSIRAGLTGLRKEGIRIDRIHSSAGKTWYKVVEG
jgi:Protein of unknown function (DUF3489)